MWDQVTDKIIASKSEHKKETPSAKNRKIPILTQFNSSLSNPSDTDVKIAKSSTIFLSSPKPEQSRLADIYYMSRN